MIETLDLNLNILKLCQELKQIELKYPAHMVCGFWGGWSLTSANGEYNNGWDGSQYIKPIGDGQFAFDPKAALAQGFRTSTMQTQPTQVYTGYIAEVMQKLIDSNLNPTRARIIMLKPGGKTYVHRDEDERYYRVRLHIPIITNNKCLFYYNDKPFHMAADGNGYLVYVNQMHHVENMGQENRYHLVMDIHDYNGATKAHRIGQHFEMRPF